MEFICFILAVFLIVFMISAIYYMNKSHKVEKEEEQEDPKTNEPMPYTAAKLLTRREYAFFKALQPIAKKYNLLICPKVRLADLVSVPKGIKEYVKWFNYIKAKHVDFTICNIDLNVKLIIELDDQTHERPDRQKRDDFVDRIFKQVNIKLLHIKEWGTDLEQIITNELNITPTGVSSNTLSASPR